MARVNFTVEGLMARGAGDLAVGGEIVRTLAEHELGEVRFDPGFSIEIDPALHSFSEVRRAVSALGKRQGLVYLAVVMSPWHAGV